MVSRRILFVIIHTAGHAGTVSPIVILKGYRPQMIILDLEGAQCHAPDFKVGKLDVTQALPPLRHKISWIPFSKPDSHA